MMRIKLILSLLVLILLVSSCNPEEASVSAQGFAKGADVSWITEMEKSGRKFYTAEGDAMEGMGLLKSLGMNTIRLRVWVNPADGWCNLEEMMVKARRAHQLNMRLMIDFHYSDSWADPGKQFKPKAWENLSFEELKEAVSEHTLNVLTALKKEKITPEWVQVGNETGNGMLWEDGRASVSMKNYAELNNAGYDAVKAVFPKAKVIVHIHNGFDNNLFRWIFDGLKREGGKWDVIGMSLYPTQNNWNGVVSSCMSNVKDMISRYDTEVMICEVGMPWDQAETSKAFLSDLISKAKAIPDEKCLGVLYWEPQSYRNWKGYTLGAFDNSGKPTVALDAFYN